MKNIMKYQNLIEIIYYVGISRRHRRVINKYEYVSTIHSSPFERTIPVVNGRILVSDKEDYVQEPS